MSFEFSVKSNLIFGCGSADKLPELIQGYGLKKVMLIYDLGVKAAGISEKIMEQVEKSQAAYVIFDEVISNPTNEIVEKATAAAKTAGVDGFIATGGGSSIDLAKAVNVLMTNPGTIGDYAGINMVKKSCLPLIAIPTTAGTSSEITNVCALIDAEKVRKYVVIDANLTPSSVIADPEFTRTMPAGVTAATGMDAITHAIESYVSNMASPLTEYHALKGLEILYKNLPAAVKDGNDMKAREQMMLGCIITGFSFSNANLGLVHGIAHTLSAHFGLAHGMANAAVLPYVVEYNAESCPKKTAKLAEAIGLTPCGDPDKDKKQFSEALRKLTRIVGIQTLSEQGIQEKDLEMLAKDVMEEPVLAFNPRQEITEEDVLAILRKAF